MDLEEIVMSNWVWQPLLYAGSFAAAFGLGWLFSKMRAHSSDSLSILNDELVQRAVHNAEVKGVEDASLKARKYIESIEAHHRPVCFELMHGISWLYSTLPFSSINIPDEDAEKLRTELAKGGVVVGTTHSSLLDIAIAPYVLMKHARPESSEREPVYIGGLNLMQVPVLTGALHFAFSGVNASLIEREPEKYDISRIIKITTARYVDSLIEKGRNIVYFGNANGCDKRGLIESRGSPLLRMFEEVIPVAITYEVLPEGKEYARRLNGETNKKSRSIMDGFRMLRWNAYGAVHIRVADPIYADGMERKELDEQLVNALKSNVTVTETNLFASAVIATTEGSRRIYADDTMDLIEQIGNLRIDALRNNAPVSSAVYSKTPEEIMLHAMNLVFSDAVKLGPKLQIDNPGLVTLYSNMVAHYFGSQFGSA